MTESSPDYCWIVVCKNSRFHRRQNRFCGHKILLGEVAGGKCKDEDHREII
jgi:hypothetical protein